MRTRLTFFLGIFSVMALSNAIVPVLPAYDHSSAMQGMIYAAYFLGAFAITLPAGILSDRFGRLPFIRLGLAITVTSGIFLSVAGGAVPVILLRFIEGIGAGLFVAASMAAINSDPDHLRRSGWFMASLNAGLVISLLLSGWLAVVLREPSAGILLFSLLTAVPAISSFFLREPAPDLPEGADRGSIVHYLKNYRWLLYSSVVLVGTTGVLTSLYPEYSDASPALLGLWIGGMSIATILAVLMVSRYGLRPVPTIRWSAVLMAASVILTFYSPAGFLVIGALAGVVMISQMAYLASAHKHQGVVIGLFSMTSYLGMAFLPAAAGVVAGVFGFFSAFWITALCALSVAATIGWCSCSPDYGNVPGRQPPQEQ